MALGIEYLRKKKKKKLLRKIMEKWEKKQLYKEVEKRVKEKIEELRKEELKRALKNKYSYKRYFEECKKRGIKAIRKEDYLTLKKLVHNEKLTKKQEAIKGKVEDKYKDIIEQLREFKTIEWEFLIYLNTTYTYVKKISKNSSITTEIDIKAKIWNLVYYLKNKVDKVEVENDILNLFKEKLSSWLSEFLNNANISDEVLQAGISDISLIESNRKLQVNLFYRDWSIDEVHLEIFNGYKWYDYTNELKDALELIMNEMIIELENKYGGE